MSKYQIAKLNYINKIIEIIDKTNNIRMLYGEYIDITAKIEKGARRYGLIRKFRENGIL
jgi:hypothetical protein